MRGAKGKFLRMSVHLYRPESLYSAAKPDIARAGDRELDSSAISGQGNIDVLFHGQ